MKDGKARVSDWMTADPLTVEPEESLRHAADLLASEGVGGAPVTRNGQVVGVITLTDIVRFQADEPGAPTHRPDLVGPLEDDVLEEPELPEEQEPYARWFVEMWEDAGADLTTRFETHGPEWNALDEHTVSEAMSTVVLSVTPEQDLREAAERMLQEEVHRLLVMEGDRLLGVISTQDIVRAVAGGQVKPARSGKAA